MSLVIKSLKAYVPAISILFASMNFSEGEQFLKKDQVLFLSILLHLTEFVCSALPSNLQSAD